MIEDYTRLFPSLKIDWLNFESLMLEETRKSKMFSIYNKTIKTDQNLIHHPLEKLSDLLKQSSSIQATIDEPYKYHADKSINAEIQLIIQINNQNQLNIVRSIDKDLKYYILLNRTNFYSTSGGQSSDHGTIQFSNNLIFKIE
jgi:alanyl-tRNA synthetase